MARTTSACLAKHYFEHILNPCWYARTADEPLGWCQKEKRMSEGKNPCALVTLPTRRKLIAGVAMALGALAARPSVWGNAKESQEKSKEAMSAGVEGLLTYLHQEVDIKRIGSEFTMHCWIPSSLPFSAVRPQRSTGKREAPSLCLAA
jgi:hypothetical protein